MKKTLYLVSIGTLLLTSSCLKKYTCKCTTTLSSPGYYPKETVTIQEIKKHSSKKKAQQICDNTATQVRNNTRPLWDESITVATKCQLKDN